MEQWVTDAFYSYFPSLNIQNETHKAKLRQAQQLEYQNYLESTKNIPVPMKNNNKNNKQIETSKTPPSKEWTNQPDNDRPISTRNKLLEDLKHTEISNMMYNDAIQHRNKENIENAYKKKKAYQQELIRQIEEKRHQVKMLKQKEKMEEEALTRKLQEELKTIELQKRLEEEQLKMDKAYQEMEQNKQIREELLHKLENDRKLHSEPKSQNISSIENYIVTTTTTTPITKPHHNNEVYKFFRNSAGREFQRSHHTNVAGAALNDTGFEEFTTDIEKYDFNKGNHYMKTCSTNHPYHQKSCGFCKIKLNRYENKCRHCSSNSHNYKNGFDSHKKLCENCESLYFICMSCNTTNQICNFCQENRNICLQCIKNFCVHCGNSINAREYEETKQQQQQQQQMCSTTNKYQTIGHSFQILQVNNEDGEQHNITTSHQNFSIHSLDDSVPTLHTADIHIVDKETNILSKEEPSSIQTDIINEKLAKYYQNYGDLITKNKQYNTQPQISSVVNNKCAVLNSKNNFINRDLNKTTNTKERNLMAKLQITGDENKNNSVVLTQLGAVRRQLQMDKIQLTKNTK